MVFVRDRQRTLKAMPVARVEHFLITKAIWTELLQVIGASR